LKEFFNSIKDWLYQPIISYGDFRVDLSQILFLVFFIVILVLFSRLIKMILIRKVLPRYIKEPGTAKATASIVQYFIIVIGIIVIIQTAGINLSTLTLLGGALGVGIGFGLQNVTNNFISGVIILFERPIKEGDYIEVGDIRGNVVKISPRATTVLTNDNINVIVPNSDFISSTVINWSYTDRKVRFNFPVGVSYNEDPEKVRRILIEIATKNPHVLKIPPPDVMFNDFGDSYLNFFLRVWTSDHITKPMVLKSMLYYEIFDQFRKNNIEIPFPQRDLHLRSGFESVGNTSKSQTPEVK